MLEKSCGTVLYTVENGTIRYLLIKARDDGYCGFPKGHVECGETEEETALRETWEETSIKAKIVTDFRAQVEYEMSNGNRKTVVYFLAEYSGQTAQHNKGFEDTDYLLLPFEDAYRELTYDNTKQILTDADECIKSHF